VKHPVILLIAGVGLAAVVCAHAQMAGQAAHAPSGGTTMRINSIFVPPMPDSPFTATVNTEWTRKLENGSTVTIENHRTIARDASGRVFEERRGLYPAGDPRGAQIRQLEFADPQTHVIYRCQPDSRTCEISDYYRPVGPFEAVPAGLSNDGKESLSRLELGRDTVAGQETSGTRETTTIFAGAIGNNSAIEVVKEFWYSPQLGINLIEKRVDPRSGTENFTVSDISIGEPDAKMFAPPADFKMVDLRTQKRYAPDAAAATRSDDRPN
jgi:hypothetical protein